ncbi:MAG: hypothetical protein IVW36_08370 [Dehalococcoidia bacterium]|nr:hypothetical protein [Dehalococcoidia bacterium]
MSLKLSVALALAVTVTFASQARVGIAQEKPGLGGSAGISGTVTFTDGRPAAGRPVEWRPRGDPNGGSTLQTDNIGSYAIQGLKDGEYFVGYFLPSRVPRDKNPNVEKAPDVNSPAFDDLGVPLIRRVLIVNGTSVKGVDFVITDTGNESFAGPDSGGAAQPSLPATGAGAEARPADAAAPGRRQARPQQLSSASSSVPVRWRLERS